MRDFIVNRVAKFLKKNYGKVNVVSVATFPSTIIYNDGNVVVQCCVEKKQFFVSGLTAIEFTILKQIIELGFVEMAKKARGRQREALIIAMDEDELRTYDEWLDSQADTAMSEMARRFWLQ